MSEPRTKAGKALVDDYLTDLADAERGGWMWANASDIDAPTLTECRAHFDASGFTAAILAIEAEAASPDALDVERLARAITVAEKADYLVAFGDPTAFNDKQVRTDWTTADAETAQFLATEYAALAAKLREAGEG